MLRKFYQLTTVKGLFSSTVGLLPAMLLSYLTLSNHMTTHVLNFVVGVTTCACILHDIEVFVFIGVSCVLVYYHLCTLPCAA